MTVKELLNYAIIETKKNNAPNLLIEDYNYFMNKAIQQYVNSVYNVYNADQQRTDDLRVLKGFVVLDLTEKRGDIGDGTEVLDNFGKIYETTLPNNYFHLISCQILFNVQDTFRCYDKNDKWVKGAARATGELNAEVINNAYFRPSYRTPYYYIVNNSSSYDTNYYKVSADIEYKDSDFAGVNNGKLVGSTLNIIYNGLSNDNKVTVQQYYNRRLKDTYNEKENEEGEGKTPGAFNNEFNGKFDHCLTPDESYTQLNKMYNDVIIQIRAGDDSIFKPTKVYIDYIKTPQVVRLSQAQFNSDVDTSQVLEFPEYVCQEILNILIRLLLENYSDPRIQTNPAINTTIAPPAQMQAQQGSGR